MQVKYSSSSVITFTVYIIKIYKIFNWRTVSMRTQILVRHFTFKKKKGGLF